MDSFKVKLDLDKNSLGWDYTVLVPEKIANKYKGTDKRVLCTINAKITWHCALMSNGKGGHYIILNKDLRKKLKAEADDELMVSVEKDTSEYGMFVPDVFTELCYQDPEGSEQFHSLTKGKQRTLLHLIGKLKSEEKQLEKCLIIFDYLKRVNGKLDFKALNEEFKNSRFKR